MLSLSKHGEGFFSILLGDAGLQEIVEVKNSGRLAGAGGEDEQ